MMTFDKFIELYSELKENPTLDVSNNTTLVRNIIRAIKYHPDKIFYNFSPSYPETPSYPKYKKRYNKILKLKNQPTIEQRTPEWYKARYDCITASSGASALDENPYNGSQMEDYLLEKCNPNHPFSSNKSTHHGTKYEPIALEIYGELKNCMIDEYGILKHPKHNFLGASPDGIVNHYRRSDMGFNKDFGKMIEIKCPMQRKIVHEGTVQDICPHYYWVQVQLQLECCDLDECDFCQYNLVELQNYESYVNSLSKYTVNELKAHKELKELFINKDYCLHGRILQFIPRNSNYTTKQDKEEIIYSKSKYIYPPSLMMTLEEENEWVESTLSNLESDDREFYENYVFEKIIYWKLKEINITSIKREKSWFKRNLPKFSTFWKTVLKCRDNQSILEETVKTIQLNKRRKLEQTRADTLCKIFL